MSNSLSPQLLAQIFAQESNDPFLMLVTLSHESFDDIRLVNNTVNVTSRGLQYSAFPMRINLPADDGETVRSVSMDFDNVSLELISLIRSVTDPIQVHIEMILASMPDVVQMTVGDLQIQSINYDKSRISANLVMDGFLNTEISSERYNPSNFPGLY